MQKAETKFRRKVRDDLTAFVMAGLPLYFEAIQQRTIKGSPDYMLCANGHFVAIELKVNDGELTTLQEAKLQAISMAGGIAWKVDPGNWPYVRETIKFLLEETDDTESVDQGKGDQGCDAAAISQGDEKGPDVHLETGDQTTDPHPGSA